MPRHHVFAPQDSQQGRQAASLLERRREQTCGGRRCRSEACAAFGRDQRLAGTRLAPLDRGVGRGGGSTKDAVSVSRRSRRGPSSRRLDRSVEALAAAPVSAATMGRLLAPGSEWRLHREWFERTALADLMGGDFGLAEIHKLYRCHDHLLEHKQALFDHLTDRWRDLFNARFDLLLYDLTSTYFEAEPPFPEGDKRRFGYSRDHRSDCVQVVIALVMTPAGLPLAYEILAGNTSDKTTLRDFLARIERQYGKARRVWLMDRGIPTEEVLAEMRQADPPVQYLVGTPKGRLGRLERELLAKPWQEARPGVQVKLLPQEGELYVFAESH